MSISFTKLTWVNNTANPAISAANLQRYEDTLKTICDGGHGTGLDADKLDGAEKSIDGTLASNSDSNVPTEKAVKTYADTTLALKANLTSPALTGSPTAPTQAVNDSSTKIATTAFVNAEIAADTDYLADFRAYDATRTYAQYDPVFYNGVPYRSLVNGNVGNPPSSSPTYWEVVGGSQASQNVGFSLADEFESSVTGWSVTNNTTAKSTPEVSPGGTPNANVTIARNATSPLCGTGDAVITKDAVNRQGHSFRRDFTIDRGKITSTCQIIFSYETSANYVDGDVGIYLLDVTNGAFIPISVVNLPATYAKPAQFLATFIPSTSTSYRLIFHVASTSALAYTLKLDDIQVGKQNIAIGAAIGNWQSYTPTITNLGTILRSAAKWRRVGDSMEIACSVATSTAGNTAYVLFSLPSGYTVDTSKLSDSEAHSSAIVGHGSYYSTTQFFVEVAYYGNNNLGFLRQGDTSWLVGSVASSFELAFKATIPIAQWTSNINIASDFTEYASSSSFVADDLTGANTYRGPEGSAIVYGTNAQKIYVLNFINPILSTDKLYLEFYRKERWIDSTDGFGYDTAFTTYISMPKYTPSSGSGSYGMSIIPSVNGITLNSKQIIVIRGDYSTGVGAGWNFDTTRWRVRKVSNGNMAEVPRAVRVRAYGNSSGVSLPNDSIVTVPLNIKTEDTHSAYSTTTGYFTAPIDGIYQINFSCLVLMSGNNCIDFAAGLVKNGTDNFATVYKSIVGSPSYADASISAAVTLKAGDYVYPTVRQNSGATRSVLASAGATYHHIDITRIGA